MTQQNKGFTLIELLITVAILGVVASIAIPTYRGYTQSALATECANEIAAIRLAEEEFFLINNTYFEGNTAALIAAASAGVYVPSPVALTTASLCDYNIDPGTAGIATQYSINATPRAGNELDGSGLNLVSQNF